VVTAGLTVIEADVSPVLQVKAPVPVAVSVLPDPAQIVPGAADTAAVGNGLTVMAALAVAEQPVVVLVTVTVYEVAASGLTVIAAVLPPVSQAYAPPPEAVITLLDPVQMAAGAAVALAAGSGLTVMVELTEAEQSVAGLVTVTVYVVVTAGLTVMAAVASPVFQAYVPPPEAVITLVPPAQMVGWEAPAVAVGSGLTVTVVLAVLEQRVAAFVTVTV
jgi:hypothetical protein